MRFYISIFLILSLFSISCTTFADDARQQALEAARQAMADARAEKARQDAIVEEQRKAERAEKAEQDRKRAEELEEACRRSRTC